MQIDLSRVKNKIIRKNRQLTNLGQVSSISLFLFPTTCAYSSRFVPTDFPLRIALIVSLPLD